MNRSFVCDGPVAELQTCKMWFFIEVPSNGSTAAFTELQAQFQLSSQVPKCYNRPSFVDLDLFLTPSELCLAERAASPLNVVLSISLQLIPIAIPYLSRCVPRFLWNNVLCCYHRLSE
jgi:hypothetical protein